MANEPTRKKVTKSPAATKKPVAKKPVAKKPVAKKPPAKRPVASKAAAKKPAPRPDFGQPIDGFFARQPAAMRPILEALRRLVEEAAPDATSSLKWGMPFYSIGRGMMCALGGHKAHVNLILAGPPESYADPDGRLEGGGKSGRHLRLTHVDQLPVAVVRGWLRTAAAFARSER